MAAALAAKNQGPPPMVLRQAWRAERWGTLPYAGGLRDQPYGLLDKMAHAADIYRIYKRFWTASNLAALSKQDPDGYAAFLKTERLLRDHHGDK